MNCTFCLYYWFAWYILLLNGIVSSLIKIKSQSILWVVSFSHLTLALWGRKYLWKPTAHLHSWLFRTVRRWIFWRSVPTVMHGTSRSLGYSATPSWVHHTRLIELVFQTGSCAHQQAYKVHKSSLIDKESFHSENRPSVLWIRAALST